MKVAVAVDNRSEISAHFGRSPAFLIFTVENGRVKRREIRTNDQVVPGDSKPKQSDHRHTHAHDHNRFVRLLADCKAVVGLGMGPGARVALESAGIMVRILKAPCAPEEAAIRFESGVLTPDPCMSCGCHGDAQHTQS